MRISDMTPYTNMANTMQVPGGVPAYGFQPTMATPSMAMPTMAVAYVQGGPLNPQIRGTVTFRDVQGGAIVCATVYGLPQYTPAQNGKAPIGPHGFHIHGKGDCTVGDPNEPFKASGEHWNPTNQPHGNHAGDFPVLFSNNGYANMCFFTNKFKVADVIGKSVIIHENPDDYRTQPAGASGKRLACGAINAGAFI